jgi:hypothetical protein
MKKTVAAIGASVLGLSGAVVAASAPASAVEPECTNVSQHVVSASADGSQNWYMDCVPQYGMGKAEFTITTTSPDTFPSGYSLTDGHQTVTSNVDSAAADTYLGLDSASTDGAFYRLDDLSDSTTSQTYGSASDTQEGIFPVQSVGKLTTPLPAGCFPDTEAPETYEGAYVVTFKPTTTTFTETVNGQTYTATVKATPAPLELGLNFSEGALDSSAPLCAVDGSSVAQGDDSEDGAWGTISMDEATLGSGIATFTLDPALSDVSDLGSFAVTVGDPTVTTPPTSTTTTTSEPSLAFTGVDPVPAGVLGGSLLAAGLAFFVYGRVRRRVAKRS